MPTKQTCNEDSCRAVRNILADAYEMLAKALEEIAELEDNYGGDTGMTSAQGEFNFRRAIQIAGNARRKAQYHIYDASKQ
ncbi:MAG: hypothetical protein JSS82_15460 [Bacteroidetes bacterium]|nr:hypothetical protein [Bacteroidota bacterium]